MSKHSVKNLKAPMQKAKKGTFKRLLSKLFACSKGLIILAIICWLFSAIGGACSSIFLKNLINEVISPVLRNQSTFAQVQSTFITIICLMIGIYTIGIVSSFLSGRIMAFVTQNFLRNIRNEMFAKMQKLPISYFDTHKHGEIMSYYTNDTDSIRLLISESLPQIVSSTFTLSALAVVMLSYSIWLTLVMVLGVVAMMLVSKNIGGRSVKHFVNQQKSIAECEGYIEEMMHGQKVIKVFCHEEDTIAGFKEKNDKLFADSERANKFANIMMPIMGNIGNFLYVLVAFVGGLLLIAKVPNLTIVSFGSVITVGAIVSFLTMTRSFTTNISHMSQEINWIVLGLAGADRVFSLIDEPEEADNGYVTLVRGKYNEKGEIVECKESEATLWAWKHPHGTGETTYTELKGDVRLFDVDFGYQKNKIVLKDVSLYAKPGQKVAFVGATGAGKTTITNLLNRFYDIADGKIRYDGININKIKKADLRRSIGMVLQDTNLFTGTVRENIRYGRLNATDSEVEEAAKIANAHDFITRLPKGYDTELTSDGANLSQGQRQLISIARAAVSKAPVMILDEATSSIDTRTELLVQKGTDQLMEGKTVFVIAHRLSTVQNSDVIMVLDHGEIIERGSHEELIQQKGKYYQLYTGAFELE